MGKSKSKKRNRTKALYEAAAAAAAKRRILRAAEEDDADDGATIDTLYADKTTQNQGAQVRSLVEENVGKTVSFLDPSQPPQTQPSSSQGEESPSCSDIATTLRTIRHLAKFPDVFLHSKDYKELRGALHPLVTERLKSYDKGIDYRQKATGHLSHKRWSAALSSLAASKDFQQIPKQGTIQRWVRDVDLCEDGPVKIKLLTSILSFKTNTNTNAGNNNNSNSNNNNSNGNGNPKKHDGDEDDENDETDTIDGVNKHDPALALIEAQKNLNKMKKGNNGEGADTNTNTNTNTALKALEGWRISSSASSPSSPNKKSDDNGGDAEDLLEALESRIVYKETASERTPPNRYDLLLHATEPFAVLPLHSKGNNAISQSHSKSQQEVVTTTKHVVPFLNGAFCLENVFSRDECSRLIQAASILGYRPDHPSNLSSPTGIDSCEWLVDDSIHDLLYDRVREYLPLSMGETSSSSSSSSSGSGNGNNGGSKKSNALCGINKRWRFFRYGKNCVYRPHIDGSWPAGSLSEDGKAYELDKSGSTRSYLTFLIYLNDDFEGGETKFYYPEEEGIKALVVRGIVPQRGSVLVFPQGNTASLLHEGSAVTKGTKYVVRTDVLYKH